MLHETTENPCVAGSIQPEPPSETRTSPFTEGFFVVSI